MRAARCEEYGGPGNVVIRDIPAGGYARSRDRGRGGGGRELPDLLLIANRYQVPAPLRSPLAVSSRAGWRPWARE